MNDYKTTAERKHDALLDALTEAHRERDEAIARATVCIADAEQACDERDAALAALEVVRATRRS